MVVPKTLFLFYSLLAEFPGIARDKKAPLQERTCDSLHYPVK